jgi:hypothetical protein
LGLAAASLCTYKRRAKEWRALSQQRADEKR